MVLWQSPDTPIMSAFSCERAASSVLESRALSSACLVSCWSVVFGSRHSCFEFRSRDGVRTLALHFLSLCECAVSSSLGTAHSCPRVFCCVARSLCFYRLRAFMLSCLVWTRGLWVFSLAACSCPVLHMAGDLFAGHVLVFLFCVSTWLLCATCSRQFVLTPPILLPGYWLIFPSCFPSLPSSFAPFIISLCLQFHVGSLPNVWCRLCPVQPCPALSSLVQLCLAC